MTKSNFFFIEKLYILLFITFQFLVLEYFEKFFLQFLIPAGFASTRKYFFGLKEFVMMALRPFPGPNSKIFLFCIDDGVIPSLVYKKVLWFE